ncbi:hypothetical protein CF319_g3512 [Tilletia indica]|nr:hypothetical protein CF319_g3512 [Tilletia indica]
MSTSSVATSAHVFPLFDLPSEIIESILVQCDYFTLLSLRRSCKRVKSTIDNHVVLSRAVFRNWPSTNPVITEARLLEIGRLAHAKTMEAIKTDPTFSRGVNEFISTHPIFNRLYWPTWGMFRLQAENVGLDLSRFPHIQDECATCPPVFTLEIVFTSPDHVDRCMSQRILSTSARMAANVPAVPAAGTERPVRVEDVLRAFIGLSRKWDKSFRRVEHPDSASDDEPLKFRIKDSPRLDIRADGLLVLTFDDFIDR